MAIFSKAGRRYFGTNRRDAKRMTDEMIDEVNQGNSKEKVIKNLRN